MNYENFIAIIPARGGSKKLPNKNLLKISNMTLVELAIHAAYYCDTTRIILSSDSEDILQIGRKMKIDSIKRPIELAQDDTSSENVIEHLIKTEVKTDWEKTHIILLQPTSPFRTKRDIMECQKKYFENKKGSLVTYLETQVVNNKQINVKPDGSIYIFNAAEFMKTKSIYNKPLILYPSYDERGIDIDTKEDYEKAKKILEED